MAPVSGKFAVSNDNSLSGRLFHVIVRAWSSEKPGTRARQYALSICLCIALIFLSGEAANASSIMAVGQDEGYSGKVLDKVVAKWNPPPQLKGQYRLKLRVGVDGEGNVLECKATKASGLQALDVSACAAVQAGAPYGAPPYGMPSDLYLSFWTGELPGQKKLTPANVERPPLVDTYALNQARDANERAKTTAEAAAKSTGRPLPDLSGKGKKPVDSNNLPKAKKAIPVPKAETGTKKEQTPKKETPPVARPTEAPAKKETPPIKEVAAQKPEPVGMSAEKTENAGKESLDEERQRRYISHITWELRKRMYVPKEAPPGAYSVTVSLKCDRKGKILDSSIQEGSGNEYIDRYVMQGIKRAKRVPAPPKGMGDTFNLSFSLVRKP